MRSLVSVSLLSLSLSFSLAPLACTDSYHPEYHPVTVTQFSQNVAYPVVVNNGGAPSERSPVYVVPQSGAGAQPFAAPPAPPTEPPAGFFDRR